MQLFSAFLQDEVSLASDRVRLTVGTKLEHTEFSGFEVQPNIRVSWSPAAQQTVWAAVSRAVRAPSRIDIDYRIPKTPPYAIAGGPAFDSEKLIAYELGYRIMPLPTVSLSVAAFYNDYDDIYSVEQENPPTPLPYTIQNGTDGQSWGTELSVAFQPAESWNLKGGYTYFHKDLWSRPGHAVSASVLASLGNDPSHQLVVQSTADLPARFELDITARYISALANPAVPAYLTADVRVARQIRNIELSLIGRDLLDPRHPEYSVSQQVPRSVAARVSWRF
jgi:iron complex outermembrane receptor protein